MYDKDLINKVCNLTCTKEDLYRNTTSINYDIGYPFKKYYDVNTIIGALNKYLSKEWDDRTLANWCCIYNWIICGGFHDDLKEDFNPLELFLVNAISWDLDGLSFFDETYYLENGVEEIYEWIEQYKGWDHIWQTRVEWKGVYSPIGLFDKVNGHQYVVLINDIRKEYMIIFSQDLNNNYKHQNEYLKFTSKNKFVKLIEKLKENEYTIISCSEDYYYSNLYDLDE